MPQNWPLGKDSGGVKVKNVQCATSTFATEWMGEAAPSLG